MLAASNTSPLLNLSIIDRLDLLRYQFEKVVIPSAVLEELMPGKDYPDKLAIQKAIEDNWISVVEPANQNLVKALMFDLDRGESNAIALALQLEIETVLMDERDGRAKARNFGLKPTGILGILLRAKSDGKILSLKSEIDVLRKNAGFFIADSLEKAILSEAGEA